jgi:general secretion pathway protein E
MTFPVALRSLLRQDPEVLMLGEIRDAETARLAVEAGLTGHLLASTMHSGTPAGALIRLLEMGIEPYQVTSSVANVVNQRLVRCLCPACKTEDPAGGFRAQGCPACLGTGFRGRVLLAEALSLTAEVRQALIAGADMRMLQPYQTCTMAQAAEALLAEGVTSRQEIQRVCPDG